MWSPLGCVKCGNSTLTDLAASFYFFLSLLSILYCTPTHQAYLRRKASGWQRQYEERTRAAKKAKIDAGKAAIRAEDMAKGIYAHVADLPRQEPKRAAMQVRPTL